MILSFILFFIRLVKRKMITLQSEKLHQIKLKARIMPNLNNVQIYFASRMENVMIRALHLILYFVLIFMHCMILQTILFFFFVFRRCFPVKYYFVKLFIRTILGQHSIQT